MPRSSFLQRCLRRPFRLGQGRAAQSPPPTHNHRTVPAPGTQRRSAAPDGLAPTSAQGTLAATPTSRPYIARTGGVLGKLFLDSLITAVEPASPDAQGAPLMT